MTADIIIDVDNITKVYRLYDRPVDRLKETLDPRNRVYHKDFYALKNISFQVKRGETVGILGKNGAGKSTLLKIITGVLTPTNGQVNVNGKIASLLELGTGFNPEYTGLENIYFNGMLMGYTRKEMDACLQPILDFADIGDFVHQPVKIYSSGMFVRLAFSVAINVEPDVLIVDEALSVGDARFQLKCYKKLEEIRNRGTTILLVTHSIETIKGFSSHALLLDNGELIAQGNPVDVSLEYYRLLFGAAMKNDSNPNISSGSLADPVCNIDSAQAIPTTDFSPGMYYEVIPESVMAPAKKYGTDHAIIDWIRIYGLKEANVFAGNSELIIQVSYTLQASEILAMIAAKELGNNLLFGIRVENTKGVILTDLATSTLADFSPIACDGSTSRIVLEYKVRMPMLADGEYWFSPGVAVGSQEALAPILEYPFLFSLRCAPAEKVLGALKFNFNVRLKE